MFDTDNSGALSPNEIKKVLCFDSSVDPAEVDKIIEEVDENGDGEIQFEEFCTMMQKLTEVWNLKEIDANIRIFDKIIL